MNDVIEVSYTGDLLAHRRCGRAWAYEKHVGFRPYEQVQAMEGRLIHHAMEWLTRQHQEVHGGSRHATADELEAQLNHHFRVLWARGIRTAFEPKEETIGRVLRNLYPGRKMHPTVRAVVEGAMHAEFPIRAVRQVLAADFGGKSKILLTGIVDLVIQHQSPLRYQRVWEWESITDLTGRVVSMELQADVGDEEIWDYKASRASSPYLVDYVRQVMTYAALYRERVGRYPVRCVLFFTNEPDEDRRLVAIQVDDEIVDAALQWTQEQVRELLGTVRRFERDPLSIDGGEFTAQDRPLEERVSQELKKQCTACGLRFDCAAYTQHLGTPGNGSIHPDVDLYNVHKN